METVVYSSNGTARDEGGKKEKALLPLASHRKQVAEMEKLKRELAKSKKIAKMVKQETKQQDEEEKEGRNGRREGKSQEDALGDALVAAAASDDADEGEIDDDDEVGDDGGEVQQELRGSGFFLQHGQPLLSDEDMLESALLVQGGAFTSEYDHHNNNNNNNNNNNEIFPSSITISPQHHLFAGLLSFTSPPGPFGISQHNQQNHHLEQYNNNTTIDNLNNLNSQHSHQQQTPNLSIEPPTPRGIALSTQLEGLSFEQQQHNYFHNLLNSTKKSSSSNNANTVSDVEKSDDDATAAVLEAATSLMMTDSAFAAEWNPSFDPKLAASAALSKVAAMTDPVALHKKQRRKDSHNAVERRRRDNINDRIAELSQLVPQTFGVKSNKGETLRRAADYIRYLQETHGKLQTNVRQYSEEIFRLNAELQAARQQNEALMLINESS